MVKNKSLGLWKEDFRRNYKNVKERRIFYLAMMPACSTQVEGLSEIFKRYNYAEVRTPIFEHMRLLVALLEIRPIYQNQAQGMYDL